MLNSHTSLGIAQVVFYVPIVPLAIWLLRRNWAYHPRLAWWPLVPLSLIRLAGGAITIARQNKPYDVGLIIAAIVLLNVGAIPLIIANSGQIRIIIIDSLSEKPIYKRLALVFRLGYVAAGALLITGGSIASGQTDSTDHTAKWISLAGYIVFASVLGMLIAMELFFLTRRASLIPTSRKVLTGCLLAAPFVIIRCVYGILEVVFGFFSAVWSPVFGNTVAFALMGLLCEYIPVCIWLYIGYSMPPDRGANMSSSAPNTEERKYVV